MRGVSGLLNKSGAEAVDAVALSDGTALAVKVADGGQRARVPVTLAALSALGVGSADLADMTTGKVLGGSKAVGVIRVSVSWC